MAQTLASIGLMVPWPTSFPKYFTVAWQNSHLVRFRVKLASLNLVKTSFNVFK